MGTQNTQTTNFLTFSPPLRRKCILNCFEKCFPSDHWIFLQPVTLKGKLSDVSLKELEENYMSLTKDQDIPAEMNFDELSFSGT